MGTAIKLLGEDRERFPDELLVKAYQEYQSEESFESALIVKERLLQNQQLCPEDEYAITERFVVKTLAKRFVEQYVKTHSD